MNQSADIDKLVEALAKAQSEMTNPVFDRKNPHFNSRYASEAAIMDAVRGPLSKNGLALTHQTVNGVLITKLMCGNQWLATEWALTVASGKPQERGSELTYGRRYNICGLVGVVGDTDDDAETASKAPTRVIERVKPPSKAAEALVSIAESTESTESPEPMDWKTFGEQALADWKAGFPPNPERTAMLKRMEAEKPKSYKNLMAAMAKVQPASKPIVAPPAEPPQPKPEYDPDAYRVWLIDQMSRLDTGAGLNDFFIAQQKLWEPCFPPDIEDWNELFKERAAELGK